MSIDEYKKEYPRDQVFVQIDDIERIMTPEEYELWVVECVEWLNHKPPVL